MSLLHRISELLNAKLDHLLDRAEDREATIKQVIRDMEEGLIELRRETVRAVAREKRLLKQIEASRESLAELDEKAKQALSSADEESARLALSRKIHTARSHERMRQELAEARESATEMRNLLQRLEDRVQQARRKKDELIRRRRAALAAGKIEESARRTADALSSARTAVAASEAAGSLDAYEERLADEEVDVEREHTLLDRDIERELELQKRAEEQAVDEELQRLKAKLDDGDS